MSHTRQVMTEYYETKIIVTKNMVGVYVENTHDSQILRLKENNLQAFVGTMVINTIKVASYSGYQLTGYME